MVATAQQLAGMEQIVKAMQSIDQARAQNVADARQTEKAAEDLNRLAWELLGLAKRYRL